jgi:thioredoxin reductase (NADPH)
MVPFRWVDMDAEPDEAARLRSAADAEGLPLVVHADGRTQVNPSVAQLADAVGLKSSTDVRAFDLVILGAGPAGLAAAVYGASEGLSTCVIEQEAPGGQAGASSKIENYLGFPAGVSGAELMHRATDQARRLGAEILCPTTGVRLTDKTPFHVVDLGDGTQLSASAVIIATGVTYRELRAPGIDDLLGRGVFYGASLYEAKEFTGEDVVIVGGANSAGQAAVHFSAYARWVTMLVRGPSLEAGMSTYLVALIRRTPNIAVRLDTVVAGVQGAENLERVTIRSASRTEDLTASGLFIFIGAVPRTGWLPDDVARDDAGFVLTGPDLRRPGTWKERREPFSLETSRPGVFAVGDVRARSVKRVASAVGEGAICVHQVHQFLGL